MREQLERRLEELKKEFNTGRARAMELEQQQATLHQTLLRISGAIQVLEEELKAVQSHEDAQIGDATQTSPSQANGSITHVGV